MHCSISLPIQWALCALRINQYLTKIVSVFSYQHHPQQNVFKIFLFDFPRKYADKKRQYLVSLHVEIPDILIVKLICESKKENPLHDEVIVGELCGVAVLRGADVFAPGMMGAPSGEV